jgi:hypothetical protein
MKFVQSQAEIEGNHDKKIFVLLAKILAHGLAAVAFHQFQLAIHGDCRVTGYCAGCLPHSSGQEDRASDCILRKHREDRNRLRRAKNLQAFSKVAIPSLGPVQPW